MNVFVTGASGFLGSAVLARIAHLPEYETIYCLMRETRKQSASERVRDLINKVFSPEQAPAILKKVKAIPGDLTTPHLGLSVRDRWLLLDKVHQILHIGASTDFGAPIDVSRRYNVEGTKRVLDLAEACARQGVLQRFDYISTAFVSGRKRGTVDECSLDRQQSFSNNYERSKYEAELLVREYMPRFDIAIHRPSIVVGDSRTGYTPHFKVLYWPLRLLSKGLMPFVPCKAGARMDVVPVDFVADSITAIMRDPNTVGETWHITAGKGNEVRLDALLRDAEAFAGIKQVPLVPFWVFLLLMKTPLRKLFGEDFWSAVDLASPYEHYLRGTGVRFDAKRTHEYLASRGVRSPSWEEYKQNVLGFIQDSRWGKRLSAPDYTYFEDCRAQVRSH